MLLYVNGDSHTAAAEAVNPHAFACDDGTGDLWRLGRRPHPDNDRVSWGYQLSNLLDSAYVNDSESASSNSRIMRTTKKWLQDCTPISDDVLVVIQWSTWERQEWLIDDEYYQVNASGIDQVPESHHERYQQFIIGVDWEDCARHWHHEIWDFHAALRDAGIAHVFFNGNSDFDMIEQRRDWQGCYIDPYDKSSTFDQILRTNGHRPVKAQSWHFGADGHRFWAQYMLQYIVDNKILDRHALSTD